MPEVSVIIPTYNSAHYLTQAVASVLAQTFQDFEVLVIDDGSTDETEAVMSGYAPPVRYIRQPNGGVAAARNRGIAESRGRYIAFLDADDMWMSRKLERQLAALGQHQDCRACYTAAQVVDADLMPIAELRSRRQSSALEDLLLRGNVVATPSSVLCERELLDAVGGFDAELSMCADWDLWVRLATQTEFLYLDELLIKYRQHAANMSRQVALLEHDSLRLLEKGFAMPDLPESLRAQCRVALARNAMVLAGSYFAVGQYRDFVRCAARAIRADVHQLGYLLVYPARIVARVRSRQNVETA